VSDVQFRVLGPVELLRNGEPVPLGGNTTLALLAGLLTSPDRVIPANRIIEWLWDGRLPDHPRAALHNGVSRLRRLVGPGFLSTHAGGYCLHAQASNLNLLRFGQLRAAAGEAISRGAVVDAMKALDEAVGLWQEPLLSNVESPALCDEVIPQLIERYLAVVEERASLYIRFGRPDAITQGLSVVVSTVPPSQCASSQPGPRRPARGNELVRPGRQTGGGRANPAGSPPSAHGWSRLIRSDAVAAAGLLLLGITAAGCGQAAGATGPRAAAVPAAVRTEAIEWFFPATMAESDGGEIFLGALHDLSVRAVNACLKPMRFGPGQVAYLSDLVNFETNPFRMLPGYVPQWTGTLIDTRQVAHSRMLVPVLAGANRKPGDAGLSLAQVHAVTAGLTRCERLVQQPLANFQQYGWPLQSQWLNVMAKIYQSVAARKALVAFRTCVLGRGAPKATAGSPEQFRVWLGGAVNPPSARTSAPPPSTPRAALDSRWSAVWARCAAPVMTVRQHLLQPAQQAFLQAHQRQLIALERVLANSVSAVHLIISRGVAPPK
jgi:hypothetical protein